MNQRQRAQAAREAQQSTTLEPPEGKLDPAGKLRAVYLQGFRDGYRQGSESAANDAVRVANFLSTSLPDFQVLADKL